MTHANSQKGLSAMNVCFASVILAAILTFFLTFSLNVMKGSKQIDKVRNLAFNGASWSTMYLADKYITCTSSMTGYSEKNNQICEEFAVAKAADIYMDKSALTEAVKTLEFKTAVDYDSFSRMAVDRFKANYSSKRDICKSCSKDQLVLMTGQAMLLEDEVTARAAKMAGLI